MKIKTTTILMITSISLCFIIMFGMTWVNLELLEITETTTEHIRAETVIARQESDELDKQYEDTMNEANELIDAEPFRKDEAVNIIMKTYQGAVREKADRGNCYCLTCHPGRVDK